jgi:hypothetical protein
VRDRCVGVGELPVEGAHEGKSGATTESKRPGRGRPWTRWTKLSALPDGTR